MKSKQMSHIENINEPKSKIKEFMSRNRKSSILEPTARTWNFVSNKRQLQKYIVNINPRHRLIETSDILRPLILKCQDWRQLWFRWDVITKDITLVQSWTSQENHFISTTSLWNLIHRTKYTTIHVLLR